MAPHQRWGASSNEASPGERKRGRRIAVLASSWIPWLLPFVALALLLGLRSSLVRVQGGSDGGGVAAAPAAAAGPINSEHQRAAVAAAAAAAAARAELYKVRSQCSNTCFKALDGICDEGRPPSNATLPSGTDAQLRGVEGNSQVSELFCDLGTDCGDCGPWVGTVPGGWDSYAGPVSWLRGVHNASVYVRRTTTPLPFLAAIVHHTSDPDVSAMLWHYGAMEGGVTRVLHTVLDGQCEVDDGAQGGGRRRRLVLDVGANFGYYTVQAALYGCRVVAFEPVRKFRAFLEWTVHAAGVVERVYVSEWALSDEEVPEEAGGQGKGKEAAGEGGSQVRQQKLPLVVPRDGAYWGLASVHGVNVMPKEALETLTVNATSLGHWEMWAPPDARPSDVILLKMDVEGWEAHVLKGASGLLSRHVDHVLLEYSPGKHGCIYERNNMSDLGPQTALPSTLLALARSGFALAHMPTFEFSAPWPPRPIDPKEPLPPLEEVTEAALLHDLEALEYRRAMEVSPGGCPLPSELKEGFPVWRHCREWMYGVHPKGFRSAFGFNTNVWAARRKSATTAAAPVRHLRLQGVAALFDETQDMRVWTSIRRPGVGIGLINCNNIGSGHLQLFRCPCPAAAPSTCPKEQQLVARLATEGKMPFTETKSAASSR
ncbi:hypothetical protein VOLCADRAFT_89700 [Volvox carteri f. nagariensis]|uniref:Methyltransferase FkbM domain-containing protein n=1 Tax=Volvox carteri f. nagariensis TaxID=3068 RepID=D8TRV1_VOLCA|nr:uncharacterized protein VOLCADRAFT_89700 [Volvox carteri f. nagariensis]EFJ49709.1 hypothetical protein VOLCADRAFT_89700 [Volvox carteri f. nagariensis]|eukprot:XP_002949216.1 hypothetical protein VOLCADRAFT_89700 [Volvox carteri f. nagariensis]